MAQKDYVSRGRAAGAKRKTPSRKKRSSPKVSKTVLALAAALLVVFVGGLYFITHNKPEDAPLLPAHTTRPGNGLPPKPEERWRYQGSSNPIRKVTDLGDQVIQETLMRMLGT